MTTENAGEMANLMEEKPIFYENKENIPFIDIELDKGEKNRQKIDQISQLAK